MTDRLNSDLDALLGESQPDGDPAIAQRRALLAGALAEALDPQSKPDPMAPSMSSTGATRRSATLRWTKKWTAPMDAFTGFRGQRRIIR